MHMKEERERERERVRERERASPHLEGEDHPGEGRDGQPPLQRVEVLLARHRGLDREAILDKALYDFEEDLDEGVAEGGNRGMRLVRPGCGQEKEQRRR